ncbi:MAG: tetratricopeptide repeat protein [Anaerolineaceae bacterium]|nr:tetratricopeptide repeat protein [Anaerolineaceae bacterium]
MLMQIPIVEKKIGWRIDIAKTSIRTFFNPIEALPTPLVKVVEIPDSISPSITPGSSTSIPLQYTKTPKIIMSSTATEDQEKIKTPLPDTILLDADIYEPQDWNNCGPVSLAMLLRYYGWEGNQYNISDEIKPLREDRNVNIEELDYYVKNNIWWLQSTYRVAGSIDLLRQLLAAEIPVMIESSFLMEEKFWYEDDRWAGHYLLLTGYDDLREVFIVQDSFKSANQTKSYEDLNNRWQHFNYAYLLVFPPEKEEQIQTILGSDWDVELNRQHALNLAREENLLDSQNPFSWFNLGSNLIYFEDYAQAAEAFDNARQLVLPQRMLRYQFGPFLANFHAGRIEDLNALADYALEVTPNSEEALLWKGWALYRLGRKAEAATSFQKALEANPLYNDAQYALNYINNN